MHFVNQTNNHRQYVESYYARQKLKIKKMKECKREQFSYLYYYPDLYEKYFYRSTKLARLMGL